MFSYVAKAVGPRMSFVKKMAENVQMSTQRAKRIQTNMMKEAYSVELEAKIRQKVTIETSVENLEVQFRKQIAQALKRSEGKVEFFFQKLMKMYEQHQRNPLKGKEVDEYNGLRKQCERARWQYLVHRHSCGFTIKNHELVMSKFPLPPPII